MIITRNTTVKEILEEAPNAVTVFAKHGVDVPLECDKSVHECGLHVCDGICHIPCDIMCHIDDIDALIVDLQKYFAAKTKNMS